MSKVTDLSIYRAKQHKDNQESRRIAEALMGVEDFNAELEREYQSKLKAKAAFESMFESPLQQLERLGIRNEKI